MSVTKADVNAAHKKVRELDERIAKLEHQIVQARHRAAECAGKIADRKAVSLPIDAPMSDHMSAANEAAADFARYQGERRYWAQLHARLTDELAAARMSAVQAEKRCHELANQFWTDRVNEQARAFFAANRDSLRDLYGSLAQCGPVASPRDFWMFLLDFAPASLDEYDAGAAAAARVLPPVPMAQSLTSEQRNAALTNASPEHAAILRAVGINASNEAVAERARRRADLQRILEENRADLRREEPSLRALQGELEAARANGDENTARRIADAVTHSEARIARTRGYIQNCETGIREADSELLAIEAERARLAAVEL